jgi:hypothetical protein
MLPAIEAKHFRLSWLAIKVLSNEFITWAVHFQSTLHRPFELLQWALLQKSQHFKVLPRATTTVVGFQATHLQIGFKTSAIQSR